MSQDKNNIIKHAQLNWSDQLEPYSTQFNDIYFNNNEGENESQYVFFEGNLLPERWKKFNAAEFCIMETGFGSGLNFLNTTQQFLKFKKANPKATLKRLHFISFELYPLSLKDLETTLNKFPQFESLVTPLIAQYPIPLIGCHRLSFENGLVLLDLWFGNINQQIDQLQNKHSGIADAWYLDGFNPSKNPEMWHISLFKKMHNLSKPKATLATFTAASFVRRGLIDAGFNISKRKGYGKKREMLIGCADKAISSVSIENIGKPASAIIDVAIIGGGISALCSAFALAKRGNNVTIYCKDDQLGVGASGNLQGALYPLLNQHHNALSQLFSNAYLYALNFYQSLNQKFPLAHQFNGLLQLAYDSSSTDKLQKINHAELPHELVQWADTEQTNQLAGVDVDRPSLFYPVGGWLSPKQLILSLTQQLNEFDNVTVHCSQRIQSFVQKAESNNDNWQLINQYNKVFEHQTIIIAAGFDTLDFTQCEAIPLSAARGQVSHVDSSPLLSNLKRTLCHEGYITPNIDNIHCVGATFKRHDENAEYRPSEQVENLDKLKKCVKNKDWVDSINLTNQAHVAIRCTTRDHFPYVGELTDYKQLKEDYHASGQLSEPLKIFPNVYVITGLGSRGLCSAPLLAETLASKINQESLPIGNTIHEKMQVPRQWLSYLAKNKPLKV